MERSPTGTGLALTMVSGRRFHTIVQHSFGRGLDWSGIDHLLLRFKGTGGGARYRLVVDFNREHAGSRSFFFDDRRTGWQIAGFAMSGAMSGRTSPLSHVVSVRIAMDDRDAAASLELGSLTATRATGDPVTLRVSPAPTTRKVEAGNRRQALGKGVSALEVTLTRSASVSGARTIVYPSKRIEAAPAVPVRFRKTGPTSYRFSVAAPRRGILMLDQSYDPEWQAVVRGRVRAPISTFALANGYLLSRGSHAGTIGFAGERTAALGAALSAASLVGILCLVWFSRRWGKWRSL